MTWPLGSLGRVLDIRLWSPSGPKGEIGRWTGLQCSTMSFTTPVWPGQWNPGGGGRLVEYICYCSVTTVARQEGKISRADVLKSPNRLWVVVVYISGKISLYCCSFCIATQSGGGGRSQENLENSLFVQSLLCPWMGGPSYYRQNVVREKNECCCRCLFLRYISNMDSSLHLRCISNKKSFLHLR